MPIPRPDLVLRVGVAGNRKLPPGSLTSLTARLCRVRDEFAKCLIDLAPRARPAGRASAITDYFSQRDPVIRLVSGLADGADQLAAETFRSHGTSHLQVELVGVFPFEAGTYRDCSPVENKERFDELCGVCSAIVELDGTWRADADPPLGGAAKRAKHARARAYQAQAAVLLRNTDVLIAIADPEREARAGGTLETIDRALAMDIPVLFLPAGEETIRLARSRDELDEPASAPPEAALAALRQLVTEIVAGPGAVRDPAPQAPGAQTRKLSAPERALLDEFFSDSTHQRTLHAWLWSSFEKSMKGRGRAKLTSDPQRAPFAPFRQRVSALNRHYTSLYRGAFLLNYGLAVAAVALATFSMLLAAREPEVRPPLPVAVAALSQSSESSVGAEPLPDAVALDSITADSTAAHKSAASKTDATGPSLSSDITPPHSSRLHGWRRLLLECTKLVVVITILVNTRLANRRRWNDKGIDYRYFAERMRALSYLPALGSLRPPPPSAAQYASSADRHSITDWLFQAIVRHAPPQVALVKGPPQQVLRVEVAAGVNLIREHWLKIQKTYHKNNAFTMGRMADFLTRFSSVLSTVVVVVVAVDLALLCGANGLLGAPGLAWASQFHGASAWLGFLTAIFPVAVASANGVRFQSECRRLADRSGIILTNLARLDDQASELVDRMTQAANCPEHDPGAWILEGLALAEALARLTVDEVAEWSVLYAREVVEV